MPSPYPVEILDAVPTLDHKRFIRPPVGFQEDYVAIKHHTGLGDEPDVVLGGVATIAAKERAWRSVRVDEFMTLFHHVPDAMKTDIPAALHALVRMQMIRIVGVADVEWIVPTPEFADCSYNGASTSSVVYYVDGAIRKEAWKCYAPGVEPLTPL